MPKFLLAAVFALLCVDAVAQKKPWLEAPYFEHTLSIHSATIMINGAQSTYEEFLKINDTALLKVELYGKKAASKAFQKSEARNGVVAVTTRQSKPFDNVVETTADSAQYFLMSGDTIFLKASQSASIGRDTTATTWNRFLEKNLNAAAPADNGGSPGRYWVNVQFFVNKDGSVSNVSIDEDPGYGTGAEVLKLMSKSPKWQPAVYNGKIVKAYVKRVVIFEVVEM